MDTQRTSNGMNNSGFRIRVDDELRGRFIAACKSNDLTAAQVLREFMRTYIEQSSSNQYDLFNVPDATSTVRLPNNEN